MSGRRIDNGRKIFWEESEFRTLAAARVFVFGEGLLKFFDLLIHETSIERIHAAMSDVSNDTLYDLCRQRGEVRPVVGLDQSATPGKADPDEF